MRRPRRDELVDAWEDAVLDRLRPLRRLDEAESAVDDPTAVLADRDAG